MNKYMAKPIGDSLARISPAHARTYNLQTSPYLRLLCYFRSTKAEGSDSLKYQGIRGSFL